MGKVAACWCVLLHPRRLFKLQATPTNAVTMAPSRHGLRANATHRQRWQHPEAGTCPWQGHLADAKEEAADALDRALMAEAEGAETRNQLALLTAHTQQLQAGLARGGSAVGAADELQEAHDQAAQAQQQVGTA